MGDRRLAVGPGDADHGQVARRVAIEAGGQGGHGRTGPAGFDPHLGHAGVERAFPEQSHGAGRHRCRGVIVPVAGGARETAEEGTRLHPAAVVLDRRHVGGSQITPGAGDGELANEFVHQHGSDFRRRARRAGGVGRDGRARWPSTYGPSVVAPAGTVTDPWPPMAPLEAAVVGVDVVGIP